VSLERVELIGNVGQQYGGAVEVRGGVTVTARDIRCQSNTTAGSGGCWFTLDSPATLENVEIRGNAASEGGGIYNWRTTLTLTNADVHDNAASYLGGGLVNNVGEASVSGSSFSNNTATYGGGIFGAGGTITVERTMISANTATENGGGLYAYASSTLNLHDSAVLGNAAKFGGGLFATNATHFVTDSVVAGNTASNTGGGIYQWQDTDGDLGRVAFVGNRATYGAGVMAFGRGALNVDRVAFVGNVGYAGAGLQVDARTLSPFDVAVKNTTFARNKVTLDGAGMLILAGARTTVTATTFAENVADRDGGGISTNLASPLLANVSFISNRARNGGALHGLGSSPRLVHASFSDNRASAGGGVYNDAASSAQLENSVFWASTGTGPDVLDLGAPSLVSHTMGGQVLAGGGNAVLSGNPFHLVQPGARLFLDQGRITPPTALDSGSNAIADDVSVGFEALGMPPWSSLTTASDGTLDGGTADLGRHQFPDAATVQMFRVTGTAISWATSGVDACVLFNDADTTILPLAAAELESGNLPTALPRGTDYALVCFGPMGEPAVAFATVP
jgi:predicted outer membrane repeat protein